MARREPTPEELRQLTEQFRAMGAFEPEKWARSQLTEGINQYARFVFLREAWRHVVEEGETSWIDQLIEVCEQQPQDPGAGAGPALKHMLAAGASRDNITEIVRVMQWQVLADLAYQLADPSVVSYPSEELPRVSWALFEVDENGEPLHSIDMLHESVLDTEPSGRELRPKGVDRTG